MRREASLVLCLTVGITGAVLHVQAANASLRRQLQEAQTQAGASADLTTQVAQLQSALTTALDEADLLRSSAVAPQPAFDEAELQQQQADSEDTFR